VELLVVIAVIATLAGILLTMAQVVMAHGRAVNDIQAGKNLITAYVATAADNNGQLLAGYDRTVSALNLPDGTVLSGPPAERYPYRLAPYFQYQLNGTVLVNNNAKQFDTTSNYLISCYPAFGINYLFVGGDISATGVMTYPAECVTRQAMAANVLVFATAVGDSSPSKINGYCILTPPQTTGQMWSSDPWSADSDASSYGNVDPRDGQRVACAFLDGSIRMLSIDELRDMRLWSMNAAQQNNPNYSIYLPPPPRGGR
jgi:hypothetical protein